MKLNLEQYRDQVRGCWTGKNIGGVLGAPYECLRQVNRVDFYSQDLSMGPPANDDLDLQIVWLAAVEKYGRRVNASILGEYWLSYIIPNWVEYGSGKANLRAGLVPPLSGEVENVYKNSNGCFIRSEIWACLAPGHPEIAVRYAYEDACVDHAGEGMYGEIFFAAVQSAAFVEKDYRKLISIGLSYIPKDSAMSLAIHTAIQCYEQGIDILEARKRIHAVAPGTFGIQGKRFKELQMDGDNEGMELGRPGFDAPENVAFTVAAWLYGEGDFEKSVVLANMLGEDTDCTAATLGATLGIMLGAKALPEKWTAPLDDKIVTMCIDLTSKGVWTPKTATELTERVIRVMPMFLGVDLCDILGAEGMEIICREGEALYCPNEPEFMYQLNSHCIDEEIPLTKLISQGAYVVGYDFPAMHVYVDYLDSIFFEKEKIRKLKVRVTNAFYLNEQQWVNIRIHVPDGVELLSPSALELPLNNLSGSCAETEIELQADQYQQGRLELLIECSLLGRHSKGIVPVVLKRR